MKFDILTIFPEIFSSYFNESILKLAQNKKLIKIKIHNLRDYTKDKRKTVDDTPYGGGAGMVMKVEPIYKCLKKIKKNEKTRTIIFSAKGKKYTQNDAKRLAKYDNLILICGRYEGVDERVAQHLADEEISIGDYVLTGGEIPAMILVDSISRLIPGVLGNLESLKEESFGNWKPACRRGRLEIGNLARMALEYPQYTKPENFFPKGESLPTGQAGASGGQGWKVPKVLLSGNHGKIKEWRKEKSKTKI